MTSLHLILAVFALLLGFGLLMVLSSSSVSAFERLGSSFSIFQNQATYAAIGLLGFFLTQYLPVRWMRGISTWAVIGSLLLLVAVLVPGIGSLKFGARSWIAVGGFQFQPAEIGKLALLLWAAHVLASRRNTLGSVKALLVPVLPVFLLMAALLMAQPDLGTTVALSIVFLAVLYFAGAPGWLFGVVAGVGVAGLVGLALAAPYRLARVTAFLDPETAGDAGYQLRQSLYGLGNGGWFGVGLGQSRAKWSYLPNADSDFIFAIVGEELGLIGAGLLLLLFGLLAYTGLRIARRNVDPFVKITASAATVWLVGQAAINIGYVIGLLPVTGIPLPMISVGGTSLIITMLVFGLLANFARREPEAVVATNAGDGGRLARFLGMRPDGAAALRARRVQRRRDRALRKGKAPAAARSVGATAASPAAPAPRSTPARPVPARSDGGRATAVDTRQTGLRRPSTQLRDTGARDPRSRPASAGRPPASRGTVGSRAETERLPQQRPERRPVRPSARTDRTR
nr:putative lipid II flippase FtsW [Nakamurella flavida]